MNDATKVIEESGSESILFAHKAFLALENKEHEQALELCEAGVKRFPFYAEGHFILGKCYQALKKYDDAKEEYERTLVYMPGHIRALNALAFIYHKKNLGNRANEILIQASVQNPYNPDLIEYLKSEKLYDEIYPKPTISEEPYIETASQQIIETEENAIATDDAFAISDELVSEIDDLMPEETEDYSTISTDTQIEDWERDADKIDADDLVPFSISEKDLEDSTIQFGDSEIIDFEKDLETEIELPDVGEDIFPDYQTEAIPDAKTEKESDKVVWEPADKESTEPPGIPESEEEQSEPGLEDSLFSESELDEPLNFEDTPEDFFLAPEESKIQEEPAEEEITQIDEYASSKDEITEMSIEQYEVNSIVDNIIEADQKESTKPDLSKFANTEDDFSTLMNGIFETKTDAEDEDEMDEDLEIDSKEDEDDTELAEERPILDTSIIFMDRKKVDKPEPEKDKIETIVPEKSELENDEEPELEHLDFDKSTDEEDEITRVIEKIEKTGDRPQLKEKDTALGHMPEVEEMPVIQDENVNIEEILANPKMLTPTFGEILIAQKKFEDARRVFTELSKKDPSNNRLKRKIDFLDKLVEYHK